MTPDTYLETPFERVRVLLRRDVVGAAPPSMPLIFVAKALDRWLTEPRSLRVLADVAAELLPGRLPFVTYDDVVGVTRLRGALLDAAEIGSLLFIAESIAAPSTIPDLIGDASGLPKDAPPPPPFEQPEATTWFELTVVDEIGKPFDNLEIVVTVDGKPRKLVTNGAGNVRVDDARSSFASAQFVSLATVRKKLRARKLPPGDHPLPSGENVRVEDVRDDIVSVPLESEKPLLLVIRRQHLRVRLIGMHFDTNKSFMRKTAIPGIRRVVREYAELGSGNLLVVGHTDTVAEEHYNLDLSVERAEAIKAYVKNDVPGWEKWFLDTVFPDKKKWGDLEITHMISALPCEQNVRGFQQWSNANRPKGQHLDEDGKLGPKSRHELIRAYMELEETTLPPTVGVEIHGCGEYFPVTEDKGDGVESEENRRVELFCFDDEIQPPVPGKKAKKGEPEYPQWKSQVTESIDVDAEGALRIAVAASDETSTTLTACDLNEVVVRAWNESQAERQGQTLLFELELAQLPATTQLRLEQWQYTADHGIPFRPLEVAAALRKGDAAKAASLIYGTESGADDAIPATTGGNVLADAGPSGGGKVLKTSPVTSASKHQLVVVLDGAWNVDIKNRLVKKLEVSLDGAMSLDTGSLTVGSFAIKPPTPGSPTVARLLIEIPDVGSAKILHIEHELSFEVLASGEGVIGTALHPRLRSTGVTSTSKSVNWTVVLDLSFLNVSSRALRTNNTYKNRIHRNINARPDMKSACFVLEDPRKPGESPLTWILTVPRKELRARDLSHLLVFFQNEANNPLGIDCDTAELGNISRTLLQPVPPTDEHEVFAGREWKHHSEQGAYWIENRSRVENTTDPFKLDVEPVSYAEYPRCNWAKQLEASGADMALVMPETSVKGLRVRTFGEVFGKSATQAHAAFLRMLHAVWADTPAPRGDAPQLTTLMAAGWSSGMNTLFQWFATDTKDRLDAMICFDAVAASADKEGNATPKAFPGGLAISEWLKRSPRRRVAFVSGHYSQFAADAAKTFLDEHGQGKRVLLHAPSTESFWYDDADYVRAHMNESFPKLTKGLPPGLRCLASTTGAHAHSTFSMTLCLSPDPAKTSSPTTAAHLVPHLAEHEAALFMRLHTSNGDTLEQQFHNTVKGLLETGDADEKERAAKIRHAWSVAGIEGRGYLDLVLRAAKAAGLL